MKDARILICDDMVMIRSLVRRSLEELGFKNLFEAVDGMDALDQIQAQHKNNTPFNVVFIDWNMPRMNGIEVIQNCKTNPELKHLPFIVISAERDHKNIVQALKVGASDYILKPFAPTILAAKLEKVYKSKAAA